MTEVVPLDSRRVGGTSPNLSTVLVLLDDFGRVWWETNSKSELWELPTALLASAVTPGESATDMASARSVGARGLSPVGAFRAPGRDGLQLAYRMQAGGRMPSHEPTDTTGLFLPLELAPLNLDPQHAAIVAIAIGRKREWDERLLGPSGVDHVAMLRAHEAPPSTTTGPVGPFIELVRDRIASSQGPSKAPFVARLGELMLLEGRRERARSLLVEANALAAQIDDVATVMRCEIRLAEIDDPMRGELAAWSWISRLAGGGERRHLDIPFAYLGAFAGRRHRRREADVYLRRALALCEEPDRRAALKRELMVGVAVKQELTAIS